MAIGSKLGKINPRINATGVVRKNSTATMPQSGAIIPFYAFFKQGSGTQGPPQKWLTRK